MSHYENFTAAILNGGDGGRLGGVNKAMIKIDDETIISRTVRTLRPLFKTIILAGADVSDDLMASLVKVTDRIPGAGPLAGIDAALSCTDTRYLFVFAGDMPWLSQEIIIRQIGFMLEHQCDIVVPRMNDKIEPLHSVIDRRVSGLLRKYLEENNNCPVRAFFNSVDTRYMDVDDEYRKMSFRNINTREDLSK